ncbi:MAG: hypothetical protein ACXVJK_07485, partial [Candidatus Aminicenantales bacterium]
KENGVKVTVNKPTVQTRLFNPSGPRQPDMPVLRGNERAVCTSDFDDRTKVRCVFQKTGFEPPKLAAEFSDIQVETNLRIVIWLPRAYTRDEKDHEEAHARILLRVYRELAEKAAREVGAKYLGRKTRQFLTYEDSNKLADDATRQAAKEISREWLKIVAAKAGRVNSHFDALTAHGQRNVPLSLAIEQAFAKDRR